MRLPFLFFFSVGTPLALFLSTVLYTGHARDSIKKALTDSPVYSQINEHFANEDNLVKAQNDYPYYVSKRLTAAYFKTKTESVVNDSADWITDRSQTVPIVSFKEVKDDLAKDQPDLLAALAHVPTETELARSGMNHEEAARYLVQAKQFRIFAENDFMLPIENYLQPIKTVYNGLKIGMPILLIILTLTLIIIIQLSYGIHAKLQWLGATLLSSSIVGFGFILLFAVTKDAFLHTNIADQTEFVALFTPIIVTVIAHYITLYTTHQLVASILFLILAVGMFIGAYLTRNLNGPRVKPLNVQKSIWRQSTPVKK